MNIKWINESDHAHVLVRTCPAGLSSRVYCRSILCQALACSFEGLALTRNPNQKDVTMR